MECIFADGFTGCREFYRIQVFRVAKCIFRHGGNGRGRKVCLPYFTAVHKGFFGNFRYTRKFGCAYGAGRIQLAAAFQTLHNTFFASIFIQPINNGIIRCKVRTASKGYVFQ